VWKNCTASGNDSGTYPLASTAPAAETDESVIRVPGGSGKVEGSCGGLGTSMPEAAHEFSNWLASS
jgi:hypothetical protein